MLKGLLDNLLTYPKHQRTNAVMEGLNSNFQSLKSAARGFHNFRDHRIRALFFYGKLNLCLLRSLQEPFGSRLGAR